ncbi:hypothetical protein J4211_01795 [Candidatus Woesearchaeota archaeon]|nr:hypothetical protein [Candidatus Woesearchaeota archaeon]
MNLSVLDVGCAYKLTREETKYQKRTVYPSASVNFSLKQGIYFGDVGDKIQTTPVHPADNGFLRGETKTNANFGYELFNPELGLEGALGSKEIRIKMGCDARLSVPTLGGMIDVKQQNSDTRPKGQGSFVFTKTYFGLLTYTPHIGIETILAESVFLSVDVGVPFATFKVRSGHERFGREETVQRDSWSGTGFKIGGSIGTAPEDLTSGFFFSDSTAKSVSLVVDYENYRPEFAGEKANINVIFFGIKIEDFWAD